MRKILLHACCAVCAAHPIKLLRVQGFEPVVYFYNPNIYPKNEYDIRLRELVEYSKKERFELIVEEYLPQEFEATILGLEGEPEKGLRCKNCFYLRLNKTAKKAEELNIDKFTTTLTVSPHKISKMIFEEGELAAKNFRAEFVPYDFKKQDGFKISQQIARENNMYKQTYCGCKYSIVSGKQ